MAQSLQALTDTLLRAYKRHVKLGNEYWNKWDSAPESRFKKQFLARLDKAGEADTAAQYRMRQYLQAHPEVAKLRRYQRYPFALPKQNPSTIKAHLRRLPSGEIQLKIPLSAKNVKAQVQAIRKALGRRVKSAVVTGVS